MSLPPPARSRRRSLVSRRSLIGAGLAATGGLAITSLVGTRTFDGTRSADYTLDYGGIGTYQPGATTSGVPAGTGALTRYPTSGHGDIVVTTPNTVLDKMDIHGSVTIATTGVTLSRCIIRGPQNPGTSTACIEASDEGVRNLNVKDCLISAEFPSNKIDGIRGHDYTVKQCQIRNVVDFFGAYNTAKPGSPLMVTIERNYAYDLTYFSPDPHADNQTHNDGVQIQGGTGLRLLGNNIRSYYGSAGSSEPTPQTNPTQAGRSGPTLSCVLINGASNRAFGQIGPTGGHIMEDNWFGGGYVPVNALDPGTVGMNLGRFWRNTFDGGSFRRITVCKLSGVIWDLGVGTANQNTYEGTHLPITVATVS